MSAEPAFFALGESRDAASAVAREAGLELAGLEERSFEGGEFKLRPLESVRGRIAFVYQSLAGTADAPASERLVRLLFLLSNLRDAGAERRIAVIPYLAYARKDRRTQARDPVYTRYVAELLEAVHVDRLVALDVHNPAALDNAFRIPVDHVSALPMIAEHVARRFGDADLVVASPDIGGVKRVQVFGELLEQKLGRPVDTVFVEKRRAGGVVSGGLVVGMPKEGATVIVLDDLCATGGTLVRAAQACREAGAAAVHAAVTHVPMREGLARVLREEAITSVVVTDSVGIPGQAADASWSGSGKLTCLPVAPLLGQALERMLAGRPLVPLLERWPVTAAD